MRDIESQARAILLRAQQSADQILAAAQAEGVKIRQNAYNTGFTAGKEDGLRKGAEDGKAAGSAAALAEQRVKLEQLIKSISATVAQLETSRASLESSALSQVVGLAVSIARRVTKLQGSLDPNVLTENIRAAMKMVIHAADVRIAINPDQKQALADALPRLRLAWPKVSHVELIEDASIAPGGCRIFTAQGQIDADLNGQIDRIADDLLPQRQGNGT